MSIPQHFLCTEECLGLCPVCGQNLNHGTCNCQTEDGGDEATEASEATPEASPWSGLDTLKLS